MTTVSHILEKTFTQDRYKIDPPKGLTSTGAPNNEGKLVHFFIVARKNLDFIDGWIKGQEADTAKGKKSAVKYADWRGNFGVELTKGKVTPLSPLDVAVLYDRPDRPEQLAIITHLLAQGLLFREGSPTFAAFGARFPQLGLCGARTPEEVMHALTIPSSQLNFTIHNPHIVLEQADGTRIPLSVGGTENQAFLDALGLKTWTDRTVLYRARDAGKFFDVAPGVAGGSKPLYDAYRRAELPALCIVETPSKGRCLRAEQDIPKGAFLGSYAGYYAPRSSDGGLPLDDIYRFGNVASFGETGCAMHFIEDGFPNCDFILLRGVDGQGECKVAVTTEAVANREFIRINYGYQNFKMTTYQLDPTSLEAMKQFIGDKAAFLARLTSPVKRDPIQMKDGRLIDQQITDLGYLDKLSWMGSTPKALLALYLGGTFSYEELSTFLNSPQMRALLSEGELSRMVNAHNRELLKTLKGFDELGGDKEQLFRKLNDWNAIQFRLGIHRLFVEMDTAKRAALQIKDEGSSLSEQTILDEARKEICSSLEEIDAYLAPLSSVALARLTDREIDAAQIEFHSKNQALSGSVIAGKYLKFLAAHQPKPSAAEGDQKPSS